MYHDIKIIDHWDAPEEDGAAILTCPNIALPCHNLCPRTIEPRRWEKMRKQCYEDANYTCQITGEELGKGHAHAHELLSIDWANQTETFRRTVCIDPRLHTRFIHSGRALTMFERGDKYFPKEALIATLEYGFSLIKEWNDSHPDDEPLRVCGTILDWAKNDRLAYDVNRLIEKYDMKFYDFDKRCFNKENWGKWKLIYDDKEYPTKFPTRKDWEDYFKPEPQPKPEKKQPKELEELDKMLEEANVGKLSEGQAE